MRIKILGTESLGVRGCCCLIETKNKKILIDPGIALGYMRHKLLPHPFQIAVGERVRAQIIEYWSVATSIVISHFHGDHVPLYDANPYQLSVKNLIGLNPNVEIYTKSDMYLSDLESKRARQLFSMLGKKPIAAEGRNMDNMTFSQPVTHGNDLSTTVIMTRVEEDRVFVHAPGIQLINDEAISQIIDWHPDIVFVDGPPLYIPRALSKDQVAEAKHNIKKLAESIGTIIIDHHIMRNYEGIKWIEELSCKTGKRIICGADFMHQQRMLLEASRKDLYEKMPVPQDWHTKYAKGKISADVYWEQGKKFYNANSSSSQCSLN